ncbi:hypothetical protein, partial [Staphylococcus aureus]
AIQKQDSEQKLEHAMSKWEELQQKTIKNIHNSKL